MQRRRPKNPLLVLLLILAGGLGWAAQSSAPQTYRIVIENMKFTPAVLHVQPGDIVEFSNADLVPHNVTARAAGSFDSGMIDRGGTWKFVMSDRGALGYRCIYHPDMTGVILVGDDAVAPPGAEKPEVELCGEP